MPNLIVTISNKLDWDDAQLQVIASRMEAAIQSQLDLPSHVPNVLLVRAVTAPHTADVFVEFIYRTAPSRNGAVMTKLATALAATLPPDHAGTFAFRAFGHTQETLFATDIDLTQSQVA
ncbi:hypothetical protein KX928_00830 [Roseobacter sp. YSTF-M11]|uniref:Uncharacterized protein n=1 Tax=Roseobacter insulae TaxID=2859783 RepID=A0A9X1FS12_9RHOB|nr:hypothetical protein [Roseobacter insulae]MBW4706324.1 hypothetical protein [Roseobacter insulae]